MPVGPVSLISLSIRRKVIARSKERKNGLMTFPIYKVRIYTILYEDIAFSISMFALPKMNDQECWPIVWLQMWISWSIDGTLDLYDLKGAISNQLIIITANLTNEWHRINLQQPRTKQTIISDFAINWLLLSFPISSCIF